MIKIFTSSQVATAQEKPPNGLLDITNREKFNLLKKSI
jgi:hypothetical protein